MAEHRYPESVPSFTPERPSCVSSRSLFASGVGSHSPAFKRFGVVGGSSPRYRAHCLRCDDSIGSKTIAGDPEGTSEVLDRLQNRSDGSESGRAIHAWHGGILARRCAGLSGIQSTDLALPARGVSGHREPAESSGESRTRSKWLNIGNEGFAHHVSDRTLPGNSKWICSGFRQGRGHLLVGSFGWRFSPALPRREPVR